MVDYIKMTQQASDMLNPQNIQMSDAASQEKSKMDDPSTMPAGSNGLAGKRNMGCLAKGCLVVVVLSVAFMALCVAIAFKEYLKADAQKSDAAAAEVAESDDGDDEESTDESEALAEEMGQIFRSVVEVNGYVLSEDADEWIDAYIYMKLPEFDESVSKARWMRVVFETTLERHNARLAEIENPTREQQITITLKDIGIELKDPDASDED